MKKIVLIDGNAIIHRAYHAIPKTLSTRRGEQTNAVYGFATTLIKVIKDIRPDYIVATFDLAGPTFRHIQYSQYKATRVKADQELYDQIPRVKQLIDAFGIPIYEKEGYEADDLIGTIVQKVKELRKGKDQEKIQTLIVSGDKDIFQLVDKDVVVYNLKKGLSQTQIVDQKIIEQDYNLQPEDFIDLKALAGDPSDNIPGVPGIGPKTAVGLLQQFGSLENLYQKINYQLGKEKIISKTDFDNYKKFQNPGLNEGKLEEFIENWKLKVSSFQNEIKQISISLNIKERVLKLLIMYCSQAFLSQKLATIKKDVPIEFMLDKTKFGDYDKGALRELFSELGFHSLLRRYGEDQARNGSKKEEAEILKNQNLLKSKEKKGKNQLSLL